MKTILIAILGFLGICEATSQIVYGYISDATTGERLPNALVYNKKSMSSALSNSYGYFSLSKTTKGDTLVVRFMGYNMKSVAAQGEGR